MFVSLVNPHDIGVFPGNWGKVAAWEQAGYRREDFASLGVKLPRNYDDDLSTKPKIQKIARDAYDKFAPLSGAGAQSDYVNFYAYLHTVVDKHISKVLDALEETGSRITPSSCALPITAKAVSRTGCARKPTRLTRR